MPEFAGQSTRAPRRWLRFRFSLRTLLIFAVIIAIPFAWLGRVFVHVHHQRRIVREIQLMGGEAYYDYQIDLKKGSIDRSRPAPGLFIVRWLVGDDAFAHVEVVQQLGYNAEVEANLLRLLSELPRLRDVGLVGADITDEHLSHVAAIKQLRGLSLGDTSVTGKGLELAAASTELEHLTLRGANVNDETLSGCNGFSNLRSLQLIYTSVTSAGLSHIAPLSKLQQFDVFRAQAVADDGLKCLQGKKHLVVVRIMATSVNGGGLEYLKESTQLEYLTLQGCPAADEHIHHLRNFPNLIYLNLCVTQVGDSAISEIAKLTKLEHLDLCETKVTDAGLPSLGALQNLKQLNLAYCSISDDGVLALRQMKSLKRLTLGPNVTESAARGLKSELKECRIDAYDVNGGFIFDIE